MKRQLAWMMGCTCGKANGCSSLEIKNPSRESQEEKIQRQRTFRLCGRQGWGRKVEVITVSS